MQKELEKYKELRKHNLFEDGRAYHTSGYYALALAPLIFAMIAAP